MPHCAAGSANLARKFLYVFAGLILFALACSIAYRLWGQQLIAATLVPRAPFTQLKPVTAQDYARPDMWLARPDVVSPTRTGYLRVNDVRHAPGMAQAAIFFVHPTTYIAPGTTAEWNMPVGDDESLAMADGFVRNQAGLFTSIGPVWAPRYRQAHFGAFLTDEAEGGKALDAAYADVAAAFAAFLKANPQGPILLAAHSQGSLHLLRLLHDTVAGTALARRIVAVYAIGWPVSVTADLPALGLPACERRGQAGCILSWQSFAEPADPTALFASYDRGDGFTGTPRRGTPMLCVNPITGTAGGVAEAKANLGTLDLRDPTVTPGLIPGAVPARCDTRGLLLIGQPPTLGPYVLPGNNYHIYDYALFAANIARDARERFASFQAAR